MKTATSTFTVLIVAFVLALLLAQRFGSGDASARSWQIQSRPSRILLDWRPADRVNPDEPTEVFFDSAKLAAATGIDHLNPGSFTFVAEHADGSFEQIPFANREETGQFNRQGTVLRFVPPPQARRLWMYFGGADDTAPPLPTSWNLLEGALDSEPAWQISDPRITAVIADHAMHIAYDDKHQPANPNMNVAITRSFPIPPECRGVEAKVAFDLKASCQGHVPLTILLEQFDKAGKQLDSCVVDPRWLSMCVASDQDIALREQGFIYPATASIKLSIRLWCPQSRSSIMNSDGSWLTYPSSDNFEMQITRAELRAAHPITFPGIDKSRFSPGITGAEDDLSLQIDKGSGFCFDAYPHAVWSEGALPSDPGEYHWPCAAGTFECWVLPQFDTTDTGERYIIDAFASYGATQSVFKIFYVPATSTFHIVHTDLDGHSSEQQTVASLAPGQWHHLAYTWDPASGKQALFIDGSPKLNFQIDPTPPIDITNLGASKKIPGRVWLGQTDPHRPYHDYALHGRLDEVRISDGIRYSGAFTPPRTAFNLDHETRALFHFDGRANGLAPSEEGRILGTLLSATPATATTLEYEKQGTPGSLQAQWDKPALPDTNNPLRLFPVSPYVPLTQEAFTKSSIDRKVELHLKPGESSTINCASEPHMDWVELHCPDDGVTLSRPLLAKPTEVDPRTVESILASLGVSKLATPRERADAIFKYLVANNDYFWAVLAEIEPSGNIIAPGERPTLFFNSYLQFGCGEQNRMVRDFFLAAGLSADMTHGSAHVFQQVFYDGSWHIYDLFARVFFPARDNERPAALSEVERDPYLAVRAERNAFGFWLPSDTRKYQFPDREIALPDMAYQLRPGESLRYYWHNDGRYNPTLINSTDHSTVWKEGPLLHGKPMNWANHFPPYTANGVFSFACTPRADHPALSDWHDGSFVYRFFSPYVVCGSNVTTSSEKGAATVELSFDQGKTWTAAPAASGDGTINLDKICNDRHLYWIRVTPPPAGKITHFEHQAIVLMNPKLLTPALTKGDNTIRLTANAGSTGDITIQYHEDAGPLEIDGGCRFGWVAGHERQLLVCQPGKQLTFQVKRCASTPSIVAPQGCETSVKPAGDGAWQIDINVPANLPANLYPLTVNAGEQHRTAALLIAPSAQLIPPEQAARHGDATITPDPDGVRGQVLQLNANADARFSLDSNSAAPLALYALAKIPAQQPESLATLMLASGPASLIQTNYCHTFWSQEYLLYQWKWYHVRAGGYPYETFAAVKLADPAVAAIHCDAGQTLISAVLALPAGNERLVEAATQYLFSANYDPWMFQHDWGPIVTGVPYPQK